MSARSTWSHAARGRLARETREPPEERGELGPAPGRLERSLEPDQRARMIRDERERGGVGRRGLHRRRGLRLEQPALLGEEVGAHEVVGDVLDDVLDVAKLRFDGVGITPAREHAQERMSRRGVLDRGHRGLAGGAGRLDQTIIELGVRELEPRA